MKNIFILFLLLIIANCATLKQKNDALLSDLSTANVNLRGFLKVKVYNGDLSSMTYDDYLRYLKENEVVSNKGITEKIKKSDDHYFEATKNSFSVGLVFYKKRLILYDDANTSKPDAFENDTGIFDAKTKTPVLIDYIKDKKVK